MAYLDAVRDAIEYTDTRDNANDRLIAAEQQIGSGIRELLTKTVRTVAVKNLSLPFPIVRGGALMVTKLDMEEVISDSVTSGNPMEALMAVFERSDCPLVAALREAVAADYIRRNASELAEVVA